jgi:heme-degrading monooxygenase HmoA
MNSTENSQTVNISFFRYGGFQKLWGMMQMAASRAPMHRMKGMQFFKPVGTGSGIGYSIIPDFSVYGILAVWESEQDADRFLSSKLFRKFILHSREQYTVFLRPLSSKGSWSGFNAWRFSPSLADNHLISVLTRATVKTRFLIQFWSMVPRVSREHEGFRGLIFTKGVGEYPLVEQATFTIWENKESMNEFAWKTFHGTAIRETRKNKGFREEMFTRLQPFKSAGTWKGSDPLAKYFSPGKK